MNNIKLSVIIPTYKRSENLIRAIDSVLCQNINTEVIVVDDNDENSLYRKENEVRLRDYYETNKIIYLRHKKNMNGACARNTGIKKARGEYITFLDDDDTFVKDRIKKILDLVNKNSPDFICTGVALKTKNIVQRIIIPDLNKPIKELIIDLLMQKSFIGTGSNMICKKRIIERINGFDEKFTRHQDIEFLIRYLEQSKSVKSISEVLVEKNNDDGINIPNFEKMLKVKKMFIDKFEYIINDLDSKTQNEIYEANYYELLNIAYCTRKKDDIKNSKKILKEKNIYNRKKVFLIKFKNIIKRNKFVVKIRKILSTKKLKEC